MKKRIFPVLLAAVMMFTMLPISAMTASAETLQTAGFDTNAADDSAADIGEAANVDDVQTEDESVLADSEEVSAPEGGESELGDNGNAASLQEENPMPAATSGDSGNFTWSVSNGTLTISGSGAIPDYSPSSSSTVAPWYASRASVTAIVVNEGITSIGTYAFYSMYNVTGVSLPNSLTSIGEAAFYDCRSMESVTLPKQVTSLSVAVFANCAKLSNINLSNITSIANYAFQGTAIGEVSIPAGLTSISVLAFYDATVTSYTVAAGNSAYKSRDGVLYSADGTTLVSYPTAASATSFTVPAGVTKIGDSAFITNQNLTSLNLGSVTKLGDSACQGMEKLTAISIPDSVTEVGMFTFYGCPSLKSVSFGKGLTKTGYQMFRECSALTDINFGNALTEIYALTFADCTALTSVVLPANIKTIGNGTFGNCYALVSFESKGLSEVPYQAFLNCKNLTSVTLNKGVTAIRRTAFYGCSKLSAITLPASVSFVHSIAFNTTTKITCLDSTMRSYGKNGYRHLDDVSVTGTASYSKAFGVLKLVNEQRAANGLSALYMDSSLLAAAMQRAAEQSVLFAHTRPDSSSCFLAESTMIAENVAYGQNTASAVMNSWMNSSGHKANILNESATTIGIGCFIHNGVTYWVQCFGNGSATTNCSQPADKTMKAKMSIATEEFDEADDSTGINWGTSSTYEYSVSLSLGTTSLSVGGTTQATMKLTNGCGSGIKAILDADCVSWSSGKTSVASVSSAGVVKGISSGKTAVTGSLGHYAAQASVEVGIVSMYRLYNPNSGEHFYTANVTEKNNLVKAGWNYEGIGWYAPKTSNTPVYRLYNPNKSPKTGSGEHHYTTSKTERDNLVKAGWKYEGIGWYSDDSKGVPLYRVYNPNEYNNNHHYTTSVAERNNLISLGWKNEGIAWYGVKK